MKKKDIHVIRWYQARNPPMPRFFSLVYRTQIFRGWRGVARPVGAGLLSIFILVLPSFEAGTQAGRSELAGPVEAELIEVIDGDTLSVRIPIWPGQTVETLVRLEGVDTPEIKGKCAAERERGREAQTFVKKLLGGDGVMLHEVRFGKYAGRVLARVTTKAGEDVATRLVERGLGRLYGGGKRAGWCDGA